MTKDEMLTVYDVASILGVHRATIHNYVERGLLKPDVLESPYRGKRLFRLETVDAFVSGLVTHDGVVEAIAVGDALLTTGEAGEMLGLTRSGLRTYLYTGRLKADIVLPPFKNGRPGSRRFLTSTIKEFAKGYTRRGKKNAG